MSRLKCIEAVLALWMIALLVGCASPSNAELGEQLLALQAQLSDIQARVNEIPIPTSTPAPTAAPEPTSVPLTYSVSTGEVLDQLLAAGLPIGRSEVYDQSTDPNDLFGRPAAYIDKANFWDSRVGTGTHDDCGMIEIFRNAADAETRMAYIINLYTTGLVQAQYCYRYENLLLRFDNDFDPDKVSEYVAAMEPILGIKPTVSNMEELD